MLAIGCAVAVALSGCASSRTKSALPGQPAPAVPVLTQCPASAHAAGELTAAPLSAFACLLNEPPTKRIPGSTLPRDDASTLARLILDAPVSHSRCRPGTDVQVLVRFYYRAAYADVVIDALGCHTAELGGSVRSLPTDLAGFAFGAAGGAQPAHAPDLIGLTLTEAAAAARQAGALLQVTGELVDDNSRTASVLLQSPGDWAVVAGVPPATACRLDQVGVQGRGGGAATGNDVYSLVLRNTSRDWCVLRGPIRVTGVDARGSAVTTTSRARVPDSVELSPNAHLVPVNADPPPDELVAQLSLTAEYRDDVSSPNGLCEAHYVIPHAWRISIAGSTLTVPNGAGRLGQPIGSLGLVTCRGRLGSAVLSRY